MKAGRVIVIVFALAGVVSLVALAESTPEPAPRKYIVVTNTPIAYDVICPSVEPATVEAIPVGVTYRAPCMAVPR